MSTADERDATDELIERLEQTADELRRYIQKIRDETPVGGPSDDDAAGQD